MFWPPVGRVLLVGNPGLVLFNAAFASDCEHSGHVLPRPPDGACGMSAQPRAATHPEPISCTLPRSHLPPQTQQAAERAATIGVALTLGSPN